jgi:hypothetical protein
MSVLAIRSSLSSRQHSSHSPLPPTHSITNIKNMGASPLRGDRAVERFRVPVLQSFGCAKSISASIPCARKLRLRLKNVIHAVF